MNAWLAASNRARLLALAVLVVTFMVGALSGAAFVRMLTAREAPEEVVEQDKYERRDADFLDRLDLTPDQRVKVEAILAGRREQMKAFWSQHGPYLRTLLDSTRTEIRAVLTAEQLAEEERIWAERKAHFEKRKQENRENGER